MNRSRRAVLAAGAAALAGCTRSLRSNEVPGGLVVHNRHTGSHTLVVRAWRLEATPTDGATSTPPDDDPDLGRQFTVPPETKVPVPDFFPGGGKWVVTATLDGEQRLERSILLHDAAPGPAGVDTVFVSVSPGGRLGMRVTTVD